MATLNILHFPDPRLRTAAKPVTDVDDSIRQLVADLFETMYAAPGIGLAATQVNVHLRVLVVDISETRSEPLCLINPEIVTAEGSEQMEEGCLSVPDVFETIERAARDVVHALDQQGHGIQVTAEGLLAVCIQHEMDHLDGKLFVDRLSALKRSRIRKKFDKLQRQVV
jgi:peptide deformylase